MPGSKLYDSVVHVDEKTGLPEDYTSLVVKYRPLIVAAARRVGVPEQDIEDAVQEVETKFFLKGGLDFYDHDRGTKFASMYRRWCSLFMLQERDKHCTYSTRNLVCENPILSEPTPIPFLDTEVESEIATRSWVAKAVSALTETNNAYLVPLLYKCVWAADHNVTLSRADIVAGTDVPLRKAMQQLVALRQALELVGFGAESLLSA